MVELATAQNRPGPAAEFAAGWIGFADDGVVSESLVGGAVRLYLRPRLSVGPEIVYIHGDNHSHLMVTGNVTWDVLAPTNGRPRSITPFVVLGGGVFQTRERFSSGAFTSSEGAFTAGGGVRAVVGAASPSELTCALAGNCTFGSVDWWDYGWHGNHVGEILSTGAEAGLVALSAALATRIAMSHGETKRICVPDKHSRRLWLYRTSRLWSSASISQSGPLTHPEDNARRRTGVVSSRSSSRSMDCRSTSRPFKIRFATCSRSFNSGSVTEYRVAAPLFLATTIPLARRRANCCDTIG